MQKYRVLINGRNLLAKLDGKQKRLSFYTTVFVEAFTPSDAEARAIEILQEDAKLRDAALNSADDPLTFTVNEIHEIESFDGVRLPREGLALYEEKPDETNEGD